MQQCFDLRQALNRRCRRHLAKMFVLDKNTSNVPETPSGAGITQNRVWTRCLGKGARYGLWKLPFLHRSSLFRYLAPPVGGQITDTIKCVEYIHSRKCLMPFWLPCCFLLKLFSGQRCKGNSLIKREPPVYSQKKPRKGQKSHHWLSRPPPSLVVYLYYRYRIAVCKTAVVFHHAFSIGSSFRSI